MTETVEAIFEDGVFRPLTIVTLSPGQKVELQVTQRSLTRSEAEAEVREWEGVFAGLSEGDIADVERIALDRSRFAWERDPCP